MAKGKLKYRDVVGGGRKKNFKSNGYNKKKKNTKPRKQYSLYKNDAGKKRKFVRDIDDFRESKLQKVEVKEKVASSSESEEEIDDPMKQLRNTFTLLDSKKTLAIESSDESVIEEDEEELLEDEEDDEELSDEASTKDSKDDEDSLKDEEADMNPQTEVAENDDDDDDDAENIKDPFVKHLAFDLHDNLLHTLIQLKPPMSNLTDTWPKLGKLLIQIPECNGICEEPTNEHSIAEKKIYAPLGTKPELPQKHAKMTDLFIKSQIVPNLEKANKYVLVKDHGRVFSELQKEMFAVINNYQDFYYSHRTFDNAEEIRFIYCLHAVNHILKTRIKVIHHNAKLSKKSEVPDDFRDQGLTRPKILIVVPFKDAAYKVINNIMNILLPTDKGNVMNKLRFIEDYTGNELILPKKNPKPEDYEQTFTGNISDDFKIGITVTKKSLKLYADFYSSDIIVSSPLGLRTIIGAEGETDRDFDFLASIELLIMDQTELFLMQNWDHVVHIFNHLHLQPKDSHGTDFSRVRSWSLNGWAKYYRQTLIFSSMVLPEINSIFNRKCQNYCGKVKTANPVELASITKVFVQLPHVFHRFDSVDAASAIEDRFDFFVSKILPQQRDSLMKQTLIYIPNYFDYVRVRNYLKREDIGFTQICEYSKENKIARARDMFFHGDAHFMLYTERYHYFNRIRVKGIRHIVFYQPPTFSNFYYEMCNLMQEGNMNRKIGNSSNMTITVIYSKYDVHQLSAIVGTNRTAKMIQSDRKVHMMLTGAD